MKKIFALLLTLALAIALAGCGGGSDDGAGGDNVQTKTMKVGIGVPESHFEYAAMVKFKEHVEQETNGSIKVQIYPATQLGNDQETLEAIKTGTVQMNLPSPAVMANFVKDFNILTLPFIFETQEIADEVTSGEWGQKLLKKLEAAGYVGLGFGDFGYRHTTNSKRPIETVDDFKGLKIRVMQNPAHLDVFRALGANPTSMAFSEVFSSLQQGVIDGQENPLKNITSNKLHEVQKYLTLDGHVYDWVIFVVGKDWYDGLTPEQQKALQEGAQIAGEHMRNAVKEEDAEALQVMKDAGIQVTELTPEAKEEMKAKVQPVVEKYGKEINEELYQELLDAIADASK